MKKGRQPGRRPQTERPQHVEGLRRCKTCIWWEDGCDGEHYCRLMASNDGVAVFSTSLAVAEDADEYRADVKTKPDFGCVMWEGE